MYYCWPFPRTYTSPRVRQHSRASFTCPSKANAGEGLACAMKRCVATEAVSACLYGHYQAAQCHRTTQGTRCRQLLLLPSG